MQVSVFLLLSFLFVFNCKSFYQYQSLEQNLALFRSEIPDEKGSKAKLTAEHYLISNERRIELFKPFVQNLQGGYLGVGSDQNLTLAAWARSEYIWLMDFDPYVVRVNKMHMVILKQCNQYICFKEAWSPSQQKTTWKWIEDEYKLEPDFLEFNKAFNIATHKKYGVLSRLKELELMTKKFGFTSFHNDPIDYEHLRNLALNNRIRALKGDLKREGTMKAISELANSMELKIRVVYTSNAEDYFRFPEQYRQNILSLPVDEHSYHVRTISVGAKTVLGFPDGEKYPEEYPFHYNLQKIENLKEWMRFRAFFTPITILKGRKVISKGFSIQESTPQEQKYRETGRIDQ